VKKGLGNSRRRTVKGEMRKEGKKSGRKKAGRKEK
jgi:hypothetical protein